MAWKTVQYRWTSNAPLIMHNGQTADPTNKWAKAIKKISSKKNKTDADYEEMARLEFLAGLYMSAQGPVLPANVIDGVVQTAARKFREGPAAKSGCFCLEHASLEYEGPRTADDLWENENFHFSALVRVQQSRVARMRPIFREWAAVVSLNIEDTLVDVSRVDEWMRVAGTQIGSGDWRPQYGRFTAERLNGK
ncbi:MAG: hypothetical protein WC565_10800 [Parcubacteria group bacterium]|jgi:hypothetical protein